MTRALVLGNGNIFVAIDDKDRLRDLYYPFVGQENHVQGHANKTGVFVDGKLSWVLESPEWKGSMEYKKDSLVGSSKVTNSNLMVDLDISEAVHYKKNIFLRKIVVENKANRNREIKLFFNQHFHISGANIGDTVYYDPLKKGMIHYKGKRYFFVNAISGNKGFNDYSTGVADIPGFEGTFRDAEDGNLSRNAIEHGSVDSTMSISVDVESGGKKVLYFWICVGNRFHEVHELNEHVLKRGPDKMIKETEEYWIRWVNKQRFKFLGLEPEVKDLFKRSLLIVRAHTDNGGATIASNDSDIMRFAKDTYSYMWPRDGALIARSLDKVGHTDLTEKFFLFCANVFTQDGYLLPKYRADGSVGSSWHPWLKGEEVQLPIQEDESALVLDALWKHYDQFRDRKFAEGLYKEFVKKVGDFLVSYRDKKTGLPKESYDLWEEKLGIHTFTCCTVYAGLKAAANFSSVFGSKRDVNRYEKAAEEVKRGILRHMYDEELGYFIKGLYYEGKELKRDKTLDSSSGYGIFEYNVLDVNDDRVTSTINKIKERLSCGSQTGGIVRYENDGYYRVSAESVGNPWFIPTLWLAEYYIAKAKTDKDLKPVEDIFNWVLGKALSTGVLSEQLNPFTGGPLSVSPLTWSHAGFIIAVIKYLDKLEDIGICDPYVCYPSKKKVKEKG